MNLNRDINIIIFSITVSPSHEQKIMQDQEAYNFWFKITPTDIIPNGKPKSNNKKSILFKLGNKQIKSKNIGQSVEITAQVLYSKALNKFCPIKGIIKIYDVSKDGSEMISCVGAFNTEELLSQTSKTTFLQRDIGPCKILLTVEVKKLDKQVSAINTTEKQSNLKENKQKVMDNKVENVKISNNIRQKLKLKELQQKNFQKVPKIFQIQQSSPNSPTPYMMDDSCQYGEQISKSRYSDKSEKNEKEIIGEELIEERRKNKGLQQKVQKLNIRIQLLKNTIKQKNKEIKLYNQNLVNFTNSLDTDQRGQYIFEMNEKKRQISLRYKPNSKFKEIFEQFIQFMIGKLAENYNCPSSSTNIEEQIEINKIMDKIDAIQEQKNKQVEENISLKSEIGRMREEQRQKIIDINTKDTIIKKKKQQISLIEQKYRKLNEEKKNLQNLYQYLQQRDSQMENLVNAKENEIQNYRKTINENNIQLDSIQNKNDKLIKIINNLELTIEEMKEQNSNLTETIESYRQKFGDLKTNKDRILQRQLKQCLRWIQQENRDIQMNFEDTTLQLTQPAPSTVNSIMKSIGQIENMPLEEISLIRKEVISVLKRLDEFVAKNSFVGMASN